MKGSTRIGLTVAIVAVLAVAGVLYFSGWLSPSSGTGSGTAQFLVHDAPCSSCAHVWVTFTAVSVHEANASGWVSVNVSGTTFDLQALNGSSAAKVLGLGQLTAGHYEQIRVAVSKVVVELLSGTNLTAQVMGPSADFNVQFTVKAGSTTALNIDIDLAASLHLAPGVGGSTTATFTPDIAAVAVSGP